MAGFPPSSTGVPFCHEFVVAFQIARQTSWLRPAPVHGSVTVVTGNTTPTWPRWSGEAPIPLRIADLAGATTCRARIRLPIAEREKSVPVVVNRNHRASEPLIVDRIRQVRGRRGGDRGWIPIPGGVLKDREPNVGFRHVRRDRGAGTDPGAVDALRIPHRDGVSLPRERDTGLCRQTGRIERRRGTCDIGGSGISAEPGPHERCVHGQRDRGGMTAERIGWAPGVVHEHEDGIDTGLPRLGGRRRNGTPHHGAERCRRGRAESLSRARDGLWQAKEDRDEPYREDRDEESIRADRVIDMNSHGARTYHWPASVCQARFHI